jgi:hypothetical protein
MPIKTKNAKKIVEPGTRYPNDVRLAIEMEQGYPLSVAQDMLLRKLATEGKTTVRVAVDKLIEIRPQPQFR